MKATLLQKLLAVCLSGLMAGGTSCTTGLTTSLVWRKNLYHPAANPNLSLASFPQEQDVLVHYEECFAKSDQTRPRAYWLLTYESWKTGSEAAPVPEFVNPENYPGLKPVPLVDSDLKLLTNGYCAIVRPGNRQFSLWRNGAKMGEYSLPVYSNAPPVTAGRIALTPVTVATDAAIVAAILMCIGAGAGANCSYH